MISYLRSFVMTLLYIPTTLFFSSVGLVLNLIFSNKKIDDCVSNLWAKTSCRFFNVKVIEVHPENKLKGGGLYLFNHTSFFDIFVMQSVLPTLRFGSKIELFKIPVFGATMRRFGVLPIARNRLEEVIKIYKETEKRIENGEVFALAPEGTRQNTEVLGAFKSGPFILGINSKSKIVPVVIKGAYETLPKSDFLPNKFRWRSEVQVIYLPEVDASQFEISERADLQNRVREQMASYF